MCVEWDSSDLQIIGAFSASEGGLASGPVALRAMDGGEVLLVRARTSCGYDGTAIAVGEWEDLAKLGVAWEYPYPLPAFGATRAWSVEQGHWAENFGQRLRGDRVLRHVAQVAGRQVFLTDERAEPTLAGIATTLAETARDKAELGQLASALERIQAALVCGPAVPERVALQLLILMRLERKDEAARVLEFAAKSKEHAYAIRIRQALRRLERDIR